MLLYKMNSPHKEGLSRGMKKIIFEAIYPKQPNRIKLLIARNVSAQLIT